MLLEALVKLAEQRAEQDCGVRNPVEAMTQEIRSLGDLSRPYWLYDEKKRLDGTEDRGWGPPTPLGAGDTAERNNTFSRGLGIVFGGV